MTAQRFFYSSIYIIYIAPISSLLMQQPSYLFTSRERQEHITISELVKKLIIPPEKRTEYDCKLMAKALYVFISSVAAFKEGLLLLLLLLWLSFCLLLTT